MRLLNVNYCTESATVITASSASTNFPASNLKHPFRSKRWRSTDVNDQSVVFDFVTTEAIDSVVLFWPKEDGVTLSDTAVIKVQANSSNVWTSPAVDQTLTISDTYEIASHYFSTDQSYRYWRITVDDPDSVLGYVELGVVWIGKSVELDNPENGFKYDLVDTSKVNSNDFGHRYVDEYPLTQSLEFSYKLLDNDDIETLEEIFRTNGTRKPVVAVLDPDATSFDKDHFTLYGIMKSGFGLDHVIRDLFNSGISIVELS